MSTKYKKNYRRNLPHIQPEDSVLFVTYRLYFKLPSDYIETIKQMKSEFHSKTDSLDKKQQEIERYKFNLQLSEFEDDYIGKFKNSPLWLNDHRIADLIKNSLFWHNQKLYDLFALCIMPNHVHIIIRPLRSEGEPYPLQKIMRDHKHYTAREANKILNRKGNFWLDEHYDHYIRNENEFNRILNYIYMNPVKANLVKEPEDWDFTYINEELC